MANLTLVIDDDILRSARIRALQENTTVNALVRQFLESYVGRDAADLAVQELLHLAGLSPASSGAKGRSWTREEVYGQRLERGARER